MENGWGPGLGLTASGWSVTLVLSKSGAIYQVEASPDKEILQCCLCNLILSYLSLIITSTHRPTCIDSLEHSSIIYIHYPSYPISITPIELYTAATMATETSPVLDDTEIFRQLECYPWSKDKEFQVSEVRHDRQPRHRDTQLVPCKTFEQHHPVPLQSSFLRHK